MTDETGDGPRLSDYHARRFGASRTMKLDRYFAVAASALPLALIGLVAFPTIAGDKTMLAVGAICRVEAHNETPGGNPHLVIEDGMGVGGFAIATAKPKAQAWFNYGITLFHAFYHEDTKRAFANAVAADPRCSMCLWGQALSRGPTQNFDVSADDLKAGLEIARQAQGLARTRREKLLVAAMIRRYSRAQDTAAERDFADDVLAAEKAGPDTPDLRLIAAESLLTVWRREERGKRNPPMGAIALIEPILQHNPDNTAAMHYYIHATEMAKQPALALPFAEKLGRLAPRASHLVHMASHTFLRTGRYEDAAAVNAFALQAEADHLTVTAAPGRVSAAAYYGHNWANGMAGALMSGDRALGLKFADHLHKAWSADAFAKDQASDNEMQRFAWYARYDPQRMLALEAPAADSPLTTAFWHYGRAEAFALLHDGDGVSREAALVTGDAPEVTVAKGVLAGRLAMLQGRFADAGRLFEDAAAKQDTILTDSMDPPPWWYPVRRSAAAAHLLAGDFARAAELAKASLKGWPNDALALLVLSRAEEGLGHASDARHAEAAAIGNWEGDISKVDVKGI
jgi:tetratricopeptide (TPR) repeat protein